MRKAFKFGSYSSEDFGLYINGAGAYNSPEKDLEYVSIPGRSGDLIYDNNRFNNIIVTYPACFMLKNFATNFSNLKNALYGKKGYLKLSDDYNPGYFRMASLAEEIDVSKIDWVDGAGSFDLKFNCKPQLFQESTYKFVYNGAVTVNDGETTTIKNEVQVRKKDGSIVFTNGFPAKPGIRAYGAGSFTINDVTVTIAPHTQNYITIDCELMDCYYGSTNMNQYVTLSKFPILDKADNTVAVSGLTKIDIWTCLWKI